MKLLILCSILFLPLILADTLPIEEQNKEPSFTKFNPFKYLVANKESKDESTEDSKDISPFFELLRDSIVYLSQTTNATLFHINKSYDEMFKKFAENEKKRQDEVLRNHQLNESSSKEDLPSKVQADSPLLFHEPDFFSAFISPFVPQHDFPKTDEKKDTPPALVPLLIMNQAFESMREKQAFKIHPIEEVNDDGLLIADDSDDEVVAVPHKFNPYPEEESDESDEKVEEVEHSKNPIVQKVAPDSSTESPVVQASTSIPMTIDSTSSNQKTVATTPNLSIDINNAYLENRYRKPTAPFPVDDTEMIENKESKDTNGFTAVSKFESEFQTTTPMIETTTKSIFIIKTPPKEIIISAPVVQTMDLKETPEQTANLEISTQPPTLPTILIPAKFIKKPTTDSEISNESTVPETTQMPDEDDEDNFNATQKIVLKDPLKALPIELENFLSENFTIASRNESIRFLQLLVSYPPSDMVHKFYNLASNRLQEAAPNLACVDLDGGFVYKSDNESLPFINQIQFLRSNLVDIMNSLRANNISIRQFDYTVWIFDDSESFNQTDYASLLTDRFQTEIHSHRFMSSLLQYEFEAPFDYSNVNLTIYVARNEESSLILMPFKESYIPYYQTVLPTLDPLLVFLRSIQKSMHLIAKSMQKWVHNGRPKQIQEADLKEKQEIDLRPKNFQASKHFDFANTFFDPSTLPFMDAIQKSFNINELLPKKQ